MPGSRLFPRQNWADEIILNATFHALKTTISAGYSLLAYHIKFPKPAFTPNPPTNAVNPAFRTALMHAIIATSWTTPNTSTTAILTQMHHLSGSVLDIWRNVSPDAGACMSESDILEPHFQRTFYGADNYPRLCELKLRVDRAGLFYAPTGVGSERWRVESETAPGFPDQNGRLCRRPRL